MLILRPISAARPRIDLCTKTSPPPRIHNVFLYFSHQIRQSAVTTDMMNRSLGKLSDGLKQALDEAKTTQTEQLEQFMKSQTEELKVTVQDSVAKGTQEVLEKLDVIRKDISTLTTPARDVSNTTFILAYRSPISCCDGGAFAKTCYKTSLSERQHSER